MGELDDDSFGFARWRQWPFGAHLALTIILLMAAALSTVTWLDIRRTRATLSNEIAVRLESRAETLSRLMALFLQDKISDLRVMATSEPIINGVQRQNSSYVGGTEGIRALISERDAQWLAESGSGALTAQVTSRDKNENSAAYQLHGFLASFAEHSEVFVTDRHGGTVAATGNLSDYDQGDETWWQESWFAGSGQVYLSKPEFDESAGIFAMLIAVPVRDPASGEALGVLRSTLRMESILNVVSALKTGHTGRTALADVNGTLYQPPNGMQHSTIEDLHEILGRNTGRAGFEETSAGLYAFSRLDDFVLIQGLISNADPEIVHAISALGLYTVVHQESGEAFATLQAIESSGRIAFVVAIGVSLLTASLAGRFMTTPLRRLTQAAEEIERGKLDTPLPKAYSGELNQLSGSISSMVRRLRSVISSLEQHSDELVASNTALSGEVTRRVQVEAELVRYRDELEERVKERTAELERVQQELYRRERLASIGKLTERIAQEMRSPLGTVSASLFYINSASGSDLPNKVLGAIQRAERAVKRCDRIVDELFLYAEHQKANPQETDLDTWLDNVLHTLPPKPSVEVALKLQSGETVGIDREQVRAAVSCVIQNAMEAVETFGGRVEVETCAAVDRVEIRVYDNGPGVDPALGEQILEPLFSTREDGIGLGLSRAKLIMEEHAGGLEFSNGPEGGTTFTLWFPRSVSSR